MKLAFCLFNYFPYGGLQRDFMRIAKACQSLGHEVHVYTMSWQGPALPGAILHVIKAKGWQNHTRISSYIQQVKHQLMNDLPDQVIGFNKMPGLDVYYAADVCYQDRITENRPFLAKWLPRFRRYVSFEKAVFKRGTPTQILLIAAKQQSVFAKYYDTESERFYLLPPGISRDRLAPPDASSIRKRLRNDYNINPDAHMLLMVASSFKTKGLDRAIHAVASLPLSLRNKVKLFVLGQDDPRPFQKLAKKLKVSERIKYLGGRNDVRNFMLAADLLIHPAYHENTGTVLLEALAAGLPVLTVDACGYANYVREANAGLILNEPFKQINFNVLLNEMLLHPEKNNWTENGITFSKQADIYSLPEKAAAFIHHLGSRRVST